MLLIINNKNKIIQFSYGEDGFDTVKVENQTFPLSKMTLEEIYAHFHVPYSAKDTIHTAAGVVSLLLLNTHHN